MTRTKAELGGAIGGGVFAAVALFGTAVAAGGVGDFEALRLIEAILPTARFLASAAIASGVTVLALLLTLIGLSLTSDITFDNQLHRRARYITVLSVIAIIIGVGILLAVTVPIGEVEDLTSFYDTLYYILVGALSLLGGVMVTIGLTISATLIGLIHLADPEGPNVYKLEETDDADAVRHDE